MALNLKTKFLGIDSSDTFIRFVRSTCKATCKVGQRNELKDRQRNTPQTGSSRFYRDFRNINL